MLELTNTPTHSLHRPWRFCAALLGQSLSLPSSTLQSTVSARSGLAWSILGQSLVDPWSILVNPLPSTVSARSGIPHICHIPSHKLPVQDGRAWGNRGGRLHLPQHFKIRSIPFSEVMSWSSLKFQGQNVSRAVSVLGSKHSDIVRGLVPVGNNQVRKLQNYEFWEKRIGDYLQGHMDYLEGNYARSRAIGGARPKVATVQAIAEWCP